MQAFSREALKHYIPVIQEEVTACLSHWLAGSSSGSTNKSGSSCLLVYPEVKRLMFRIAMRILLGFQPSQTGSDSEQQLVEAFEEMIRNLFSLPIDVPFSGLYKVTKLAGGGWVGKRQNLFRRERTREPQKVGRKMKVELGHTQSVFWAKSILFLLQGLRARDIIHAKIEENIRAKLARKLPADGYKDVLQLLIEHTQSNGEQLNMQVSPPGHIWQAQSSSLQSCLLTLSG